MNLELERFIENQTEMLGNLTITDSIDEETLTDICEEYHKRKLKLLGIADVMGWRFVKDNEENLKAMPNDRDFEVLFDDGTILNFSDEDFPFAKIIAWREIACP
jgi:hypothetical protein